MLRLIVASPAASASLQSADRSCLAKAGKTVVVPAPLASSDHFLGWA